MEKNEAIKVSELDLKVKVVKIKRVVKVVKGGRVLSFSALVVLGDRINVVGFGFAKARGVSQAVEKATSQARKKLIRVPVLGKTKTIPHEIRERHKASDVLLKPGPPGTGIKAGGPMRTVLESAGILNVLAKARGANNPHNVVQATINALKALEDPYTIAGRRGISMEKVFDG